MALAFNISGIAVSGSNVEVVSRLFQGLERARLYLANTGDAALTAAKVQLGPTEEDLYDYDTDTFKTLAAGAMLGLQITGPISALKVLATCEAGTTLRAWLDTEVGSAA